MPWTWAHRAVSSKFAPSLPIRPTATLPVPKDSTSGWFVLAGLFVLCLLPRAVMTWRMPGICPDAVLYIRLGKALEIGQYQAASGQLRFNIYPFILSFVHELGLSWETAGMAWGAFISSCTVLPLYGLIRRIFMQFAEEGPAADDSRRVAIVACVLYAIHSGLIRWSVETVRDSTFWFLLTLSLYLLWRAVTELRWPWYLAAGAAIALACLTRFEGLVLFVPLLGWSWWRAKKERENVRQGERETKDFSTSHALTFSRSSSQRLLLSGLLCASIYPLSLLLINTFWFHGQTTELVRTKPVELAQDWARESIAGQRSVEKQISRPDLLPPLPPWNMAGKFAVGMLRGFTPLYLLAVAGGIAGLWQTPLRRAYLPLACASALILAAVWVHLYWSHEAGPRYFFPVVIMSAPLAGWWLLQVSRASALRVRIRHSRLAAWLAGAAPLAAMLIVNSCVACGTDFQNRAATIELGRWLHTRYGSPKMVGPDGATQIVAYYAQSQCDSFPETAKPAVVTGQIEWLRPSIVLLPADRCESPGDALAQCVEAQGFAPVDRSRLPAGCRVPSGWLRVLVRQVSSQGDKPRS
jgi:hypothetical protein